MVPRLTQSVAANGRAVDQIAPIGKMYFPLGSRHAGKPSFLNRSTCSFESLPNRFQIPISRDERSKEHQGYLLFNWIR